MRLALMILVLVLFSCGSSLSAATDFWSNTPQLSNKGNAQQGGGYTGAPLLRFHRYLDRTEAAFLLLVPEGWTTEGGIFRVDPMAAGGAGQSIEAKIDFTLRRDPLGQVMIRFIPHTNYIVPGAYGYGTVINGMPVLPMPTPANFLTSNFGRLRPTATNVRVLETHSRPDIVQAVLQGPKARSLQANGAQYYADAGMVTVSYQENGTAFKEMLFTAIEGFSIMDVAMWSNCLTIVARAPAAEAEIWIPAVKVVLNSFALNPRWAEAEARGQRYRSGVAADTMAAIAEIDRAIAANRTQTQQSIQHENYLNLTNQEEYLNPFTGTTELGSNEWKYRWENNAGEIIYTDNGTWDPNIDPQANLQGFQRSAIRPRR
ncbi:MAG: hypothetical protein PHI97_20835 [Desulfobulbus sp.]|nr:hypothetical protein [Desulfobulbus sp.]